MKKNKSARVTAPAVPLGLREVLDAAPEAIICFDVMGAWSWLSPAVERLAGVKPATLIGRRCLEILPPSEHRRAIRLVLKLQTSSPGTSRTFVCPILHPEMGERRIELSLRVIERPDGELAFVGVAREWAEHAPGALGSPAIGIPAVDDGSWNPTSHGNWIDTGASTRADEERIRALEAERDRAVEDAKKVREELSRELELSGMDEKKLGKAKPSELRKEIRALESRLKDLGAGREMGSESSTPSGVIEESAARLAALESELSEVRQRAAWLASELLESRSALKDAETQRDEAKETARKLTQSRVDETQIIPPDTSSTPPVNAAGGAWDLNIELESLRAQFVQERERREQAESQRDRQRARFETERDELRSEVTSLRERVKETQAGAGAAKEAEQKLDAERASSREAEQRADQLEKQLEIERAATAAAARRADELRDENDTAKANLRLLEQRSEDLGTEIEKLRQSEARPLTGAEGGRVAELTKQLEEVTAERERARAEVRERAELLSTLNHEIRNPMNGVIGMSDLLLDTQLDDGQRQQVEVIRNSARGLMSLLGDWMDFSRLGIGKVELDHIDFDLRVTMDEVHSILRPLAAEKHLAFERQVHHEVPSRVRGDAGRLRQVLLNLGGNSIRFTERGSVSIGIERVEETDERVVLRFTISDTGLGIAEATAAGFFQSRSGSRSANAPRHGPHGMGLTVARQIVQLMGGETGVENQPGSGSRFWFQIQLGKQPEVMGAGSATLRPVRGARVLVADGARASRQALAHTLATCGNRVDEAANAEEALARLERAAADQDPYLAAFLDMSLPDVNGEQLGSKIRANPALSSTRMVLLADVGQPGDGTRSHDLGFSGYFVKPMKPWEIESALAEVLRDDPAAGERQPLVTRHSVAENKRSRVTILVVDDDTVSQLVSDWTLRRHGYRVERATSGEEALSRYKEFSPDLVLVDLALPDIDGFELARRLRASDEGGRHRPIVAVTGRVEQADRDRCRAAGMDDYLTKPVELSDLTRIVERWTTGAASNAPGRPPESGPAVPNTPPVTPPVASPAAPVAPPAPPPSSAPSAQSKDAPAPKRSRTTPTLASRPDVPSSPSRGANSPASPPGTVARKKPVVPGSLGDSGMMNRPTWLSDEDSAATGSSPAAEPEAPEDPSKPVRLSKPGEPRETPEKPMEGFELRPRTNSEDGPPLELTDDPDSMMGAPHPAAPRPALSPKPDATPPNPAPPAPTPPAGNGADRRSPAPAAESKASREIQIKPDSGTSKLMGESPLDMKRLDDASMGIPAFRDALLRTFLNDLRPRLDRLDQALLNRSSDRLEMEAHGLKGMSATIGATKVAEIFSEIERLSRENMLEQAEEMIAKARLEAERLEAHLKTLNMRRGRAA